MPNETRCYDLSQACRRFALLRSHFGKDKSQVNHHIIFSFKLIKRIRKFKQSLVIRSDTDICLFISLTSRSL